MDKNLKLMVIREPNPITISEAILIFILLQDEFFYFGGFCNLAFNASITAEKSWSLRPWDFATLYSSFAAAAIGVGWETDSASPSASLRSCHHFNIVIRSGKVSMWYWQWQNYKPFVDALKEMQSDTWIGSLMDLWLSTLVS